MTKSTKYARIYKHTHGKVRKIGERYNKSVPQVLDALLDGVASVEELDNIFGYTPKKRKK